jgi:hypothetical protein
MESVTEQSLTVQNEGKPEDLRMIDYNPLPFRNPGSGWIVIGRSQYSHQVTGEAVALFPGRILQYRRTQEIEVKTFSDAEMLSVGATCHEGNKVRRVRGQIEKVQAASFKSEGRIGLSGEKPPTALRKAPSIR